MIRTFFMSIAMAGLAIRALAETSAEPLRLSQQVTSSLESGKTTQWQIEGLTEGAQLEIEAHVPLGEIGATDTVSFKFSAEEQRDVVKTLNAGDPGLLIPVRVSSGGKALIEATATSSGKLSFNLIVRPLAAKGEERAAFETEPNNSWKEAQTIYLGRHVYGNNDDADYFDNKDERPVKNFASGLDNPVRDRVGLDWFKIEWTQDAPVLALFELDILDRDVSVNLRMYKPNADGTDVELYLEGKDPMEIIHDREPERYSKAISRVLPKGTYYLQVNGNHPRYILRSTLYDTPPYKNPYDAVALGSHYIMNVGDAWLAQVPREGNIYNRVQNMHETTLRCTACHPSIFSTESVLAAKKAGYPIQAKSNFRYVVDRIYNGPAPLYGPSEVNWQRYIAIPMQSQGKHGGILMDYEKLVSGRETPYFLRYAPFLRKAWTGSLDVLDKLHEDEQNGVVPADSNVGFATRDWKVLMEAYRRTGDRSWLDAADNIRAWLLSDKCDDKNIQDKIHKVWALSLLNDTAPDAPFKNDPPLDAEKAAAIEAVLKLRNPDGGWPDQIEPGRASAVYTTGQVLWTLAQAGVTIKTNPELQSAADYIISQQQSFGGWFQTTTHENFQTPMRETRYAVMGLAAMFPLTDLDAKDEAEAKAPGSYHSRTKHASPRGWGNRNGVIGSVPRTDTLLHCLDDLDGLWEVPAEREGEITWEICKLLESKEPLIRATAAEALGRIGNEVAIESLAKLLNDPVKDVWRSAAWSLRQFGNRGRGVETVKMALTSADPATRRGASRVFTNQFYGLTERFDIARDMIKLAGDSNIATRLEAVKSLRQWFYRVGENGLKREIVDAYIDRMDKEESRIVRTNLEQGMYILLDENQEGGVSLERNIARFPQARDREEAIAGRRHVEQSVLLEPVLDALEHGTVRQRESLLASFDGSFFAGRFYARNPRGMIDVGNDREFGFYYDPPERKLDRVFASLLQSDLPTAPRAEAFQLASFFHVPAKTTESKLQEQLLGGLNDPAPEVREAAVRIVRDELNFKSAEGDALHSLADRIVALAASGNETTRLSILSAAKRAPALLAESRIRDFAKATLDDPTSRSLALALVETDLMDDASATKLLEDAWSEAEQDAARLDLVNRLFARKTMADTDEPSRELTRLLRAMALDPSTGVRERLIEQLEKTEKLRRTPKIASVLHGGLSDSSPGIRLRSLKLAGGQTDFWREGDTTEYMLRLLTDPDAKIRALAFETVEKFDLLSAEPRYARRLKALTADPALGEKTKALLVAKNYDPATLEADGSIQSYGIPDLEFFKEKVNPYFYVEGADGHSCQDCHQTHNILRIEPIPLGETSLPDDLVIQNLNSALKVVNLGDPEQSLILRKPRSPAGQGTASADSPTGITHVGGPRWPSATDPAYQEFLAWIRDAAQGNKRRIGKSVSVDSYSPDYPPNYALDGDPQTIWHTEFVGASPGYPHEIILDLGEPSTTSAFQYVPRQESSNGRVRAWELYASEDGIAWGEKIASGEWADDAAVKTVPLRARGIRFVKLRGLSSVNNQPFMSAAEVIVLKSKEEIATGN